MSSRNRRFMAALAATFMLIGTAVPSTVLANELQPDASSVPVPFDVLVMRPVGFVSLVNGTALFAAALPLVLITRPQDIGKPAEVLVARPARFLWRDGLGEH